MDHWSVTVNGIIAHLSDVAPGPLITSHDECSSELFFFFIKMCFAYWQSVSALSLYFIISRANVYWSIELEGGGGYVIKFKSLSKAFRKGRFFLNWKGRFLINCTLKFVLTKHRAITAQSIKNRKVFPYIKILF